MTMNGNSKPAPREEEDEKLPAAPVNGAETSNNVGASADVQPAAIDTVRQRHQYDKKSSSNNNYSVNLSGGSPTDADASYCTEIARRSVARAALHLGLEGMDGEALDVLGSVLLGYMDEVRFHFVCCALSLIFAKKLSRTTTHAQIVSLSGIIFIQNKNHRSARQYPQTSNFPADRPPMPMPMMSLMPWKIVRRLQPCSWVLPRSRYCLINNSNKKTHWCRS